MEGGRDGWMDGWIHGWMDSSEKLVVPFGLKEMSSVSPTLTVPPFKTTTPFRCTVIVFTEVCTAGLPIIVEPTAKDFEEQD